MFVASGRGNLTLRMLQVGGYGNCSCVLIYINISVCVCECACVYVFSQTPRLGMLRVAIFF